MSTFRSSFLSCVVSRFCPLPASWHFALLILMCAAALAAVPVYAATPSSGTLTDATTTLVFTSGPFTASNPTSQVNGAPDCSTLPCDDFALTVSVSSATTANKWLKITTRWMTVGAQIDLYVLDSGGNIVASSMSSNTFVDPDLLLLPAKPGTYTVRIVPFAGTGQTATTTIALVNKTPAPPLAAGAAPRFQNYTSPPGIGEDAGEPSIGCDWNPNVAALKHDKVNTGGVAFFASGPHALRVSFDDCSSPAKQLWEDVSTTFVIQSALSDPIGFVDHQTGRVFSLDLIGGEGNSHAAFSDDDGNTWLPMQGGGLPAGPDHETLGAGPYAAPLTSAVYKNAVYYCSQNIVGNAECSRSDDGGVTFGPGVLLFQNPTQCIGGIHGHVKVAPDGSVYVPHFTCGVNDATAGFTVSTDNGITWVTHTVPGSIAVGDPSVGIGMNNVGRPAGALSNSVYIGWVDADGHPKVAVSHDRGATFGPTYDVGLAFGIQNTVFPTVVAGDDNRAAFGFVGSTTAGANYTAPDFAGLWHFYIATTYDGGNSWVTADATPNDPVQIGGICTLGTIGCNGDRNLLDFNDITVDREGRLLAAYADGCVAPGCNSNSPYYASRAAKAAILRQSGGRRMFAAFDPVEPALPGAPRIDSASPLAAGGVDLKWSAPDNGGSPLTGYNIYRGTASGNETLLTTVDASSTEYIDSSASNSQTYFYRVSATNAQGVSPLCGETPTSGPPITSPSPTSCNGVMVITDGTGDAVNPIAPNGAAGNLDTVDIVGASFALDATRTNLVTTMTLKNLSQVPVNGTTSTAYYVAWQSTDGNFYASLATFPTANGQEAFVWGQWDPNLNQLLTINFTTGTFTQGPNGTVSVNVPLSGIGNPTIPVTSASAVPAVRNPYAIVFSGEGPVLGGGVFFTQPADRAPNSGFGQSWAVCVGGAATHLAISAPTGAGVNQPVNVTVTALDASNNVASTYGGTVHVSSSDPAANLPANYTFSMADAGVHTFSATFQTAGNQSITATDTANSSLTASANVNVSSGSTGSNCINPASLVVSDATGDQNTGFGSGFDIQSVSVGEDYRYIGNQRLILQLKVADLSSVPANGIWRVRFTFGGTTYYVAMTSDGNSIVNYEYGTQSGSTVTTVGGIESGTFSTDGTITMEINMSKVGTPTGGSVLTAVNGVTQSNVGGTLFAGVDSTSSADYTMRPQPATCSPGPLPPAGITATYVKGGMLFSPNVTLHAPHIGQDVEPSIASDLFGNTYVAPIRGVPGGTDLWYFDLRPTVPGAGGSPVANPLYDPNMRNPQYRGQPDSITGSQEAAVGGDGGGDVSLAVGAAPPSPGAPPTLAWSSLVLSNISTQRSTDMGQTFLKNPVGNLTGGVPGNDRQWLAFYGPNTVYLLYRTVAPGIVGPAIALMQQSLDGGLTYGPAAVVGLIGQVGGVDVDQHDGTVYASGSNGVVAVGIPPAPGVAPATYTIHNVAGTGKAHLFFTVKVAPDGTVYVCYSDDHSVFVQYSRDKGNTWSSPIRVNDGADTQMAIFPWIATSSVPGTIGVVWYGTPNISNTDADDWNVFYALGTNVTSNAPTFQQVIASDHIIHAGNVSEAGLVINGQNPNRNLADFFQVAFDPTGAAVIAYADDHNDFAGQTFVTRQVAGPGANGSAVPAPVEGSALPPPSPFPPGGPQVFDYRDDIRTGGNPEAGGLIVLPVDDPLDLLSIKYATDTNPATGEMQVSATMSVSDMKLLPPSSSWRINFAANAPHTGIAVPGDYDFGVSDRADQFYLRADTDNNGNQTFVYGTAVRTFSGGITYTDLGAADFGFFDPVNKTVTMKVGISKLNAALSAAGHPLVGAGSVFAGLRGQALTNVQGSAFRLDTARGGTEFLLDRPPVAALVANPSSGIAPASIVLDGSGSSDPDAGDHVASFTFTFGDGSPAVTTSSPSITHVYQRGGTFTATLSVADASGMRSTNTASATITVDTPPKAVLKATPTAGFDPLTVSFDGSQSSDADAGDSVVSYSFNFGDGSSAVSQSTATAQHTYTQPGTFTAMLVVRDTHGASSAPASATISVQDRPPIAFNQSVTTNEDSPVTITLKASDGDTAGLNFSIVQAPAHGTLGTLSAPSCSPAGAGSTCTATVQYTPGTNYSGSDSFTFKANDGLADSNVATVSITVNHVPEPTGRATGSGEINVSSGGTASFGFNVQRKLTGGAVSGSLQYQEHNSGLNVQSTSVNVLSFNGNSATFGGTCTANGSPCTFTITVQDNGEPGAGKDKFTISVSGEPTQGGTIVKGNIQVKTP